MYSLDIYIYIFLCKLKKYFRELQLGSCIEYIKSRRN